MLTYGGVWQSQELKLWVFLHFKASKTTHVKYSLLWNLFALQYFESGWNDTWIVKPLSWGTFLRSRMLKIPSQDSEWEAQEFLPQTLPFSSVGYNTPTGLWFLLSYPWGFCLKLMFEGPVVKYKFENCQTGWSYRSLLALKLYNDMNPSAFSSSL